MAMRGKLQRKKLKSGRELLFLAVSVAALMSLVFSGFMFARSYQGLKDAIQKERMDYVQEISAQIIVSQQFMENEYSNAIASYAGILNSYQFTSVEEVRRHFTGVDNSRILLISEQGDLVDLNGEKAFISSSVVARQLYGGTGISQVFTSLNNTSDYWLFSSPVNAVALDEVTYCYIVLAVPSADFRNNLSVSLFDHRGASYIIKNDGSIAVKPEKSNKDIVGYNLYEGLRNLGADETVVSNLRADVEENESGSFILETTDETWLISYDAIDDQNALVVTVPLTITAAQTYDGLSGTIMSAVATVLAVAVIGVLMIAFFFYRDQQRRREAMVVAAKNDFFSKMSHDIRTPLNAVIGLELLALESVDRPDEVTDCLTKSSAAANYLLSIINDVLDMSRIESGKLTVADEPFDMNQLLSEIDVIVSPMANEKGLRFAIEVERKFETNYRGDQVRMKQILMNLLSNATKFTKPGGHVWLKLTHCPGPADCDTVTIQVADDGIGMGKEYLSRIFIPFEQERSSLINQTTGSGLGLSIVHNLVSLMGGTIQVESAVHAGSCFTIVLPLERSNEIVPRQDAAAVSVSAFAGKRVLLAEDNAVNQQVAVAILTKKFGLMTEVANNGKQAIELLAASPAGYYDLILMDVKMPLMDGLEATRQIRALNHPDATTIPIVALSANAFEEDIAMSLAAGMNAHLSKPINVVELSGVLEKKFKR